MSRTTNPDGSFSVSLQGRLFAADGSALTANFRIDTDAAPYWNGSNEIYRAFQVGMDDAGDCVAGWYDPIHQNIVVCRFAATGSAKDANGVVIRSQPTAALTYPLVSVDMNRSTGDFTVAWQESSSVQLTSKTTQAYSYVYAEQFTATGAAVNSQPVLVDSCSQQYRTSNPLPSLHAAITQATTTSKPRLCYANYGEVLQKRDGSFDVIVTSSQVNNKSIVSSIRFAADGSPVGLRKAISSAFGVVGIAPGEGQAAGDGERNFMPVWQAYTSKLGRLSRT